MKKAFADVNKLNKLEAVGLTKKICKFAEESGELMQVICRHIGMKANKMSATEMREEALGEIADVVQNSFCIANEFNISLEEIENHFSVKSMFKNGNKISKEDTLENLGCDFYVKSGKLAEDAFLVVDDEDLEEFKFDVCHEVQQVLTAVFAIAAKLKIKYEEIEPKILEKDKKWLLRIDKNIFKK